MPSVALTTLKEQLRNHPLYARIDGAEALRVFMERHVLCVWDFMSVLKSLQRDLTCVSVPWCPPADPQAARLINEIVLDEETDRLEPGRYGAHFDLYRSAMQQVGCDLGPTERLIAALRRGLPWTRALAEAGLPREATAFVETTLGLLGGPLHTRAAVFFHGREDVIPSMFTGLQNATREGEIECARFIDYLERHIEADGERHGPAAEALLARLLDGSDTRTREAEAAARTALEARIHLWDACLAHLRLQSEVRSPHP